MSTKAIKHLLDQCNELIQDREDSTTRLYDMDKVKELFVNFTRVALLTKEITQSEVLVGNESELSQLASQFKQQQQDYAKDQKFKRNCIEAIVDFIENAEKTISNMTQVDDLTEANAKAEKELQKLRDELEKNGEQDLSNQFIDKPRFQYIRRKTSLQLKKKNQCLWIWKLPKPRRPCRF